MNIPSDFVLEGLLQHNYFPDQKEKKEELPPCFLSESFTPQVAQALIAEKPRKEGYDTVEYNLTRFNGVARILNIPHPHAYAKLACSIAEHWDKFDYIVENPNSLIRPESHSDGRLFIMDYESSQAKVSRFFRKGLTICHLLKSSDIMN